MTALDTRPGPLQPCFLVLKTPPPPEIPRTFECYNRELCRTERPRLLEVESAHEPRLLMQTPYFCP